MRTLVKATLGLSFIGAMAIGPTVPVQTQGFYLDAPGVHIGTIILTLSHSTVSMSGVGSLKCYGASGIQKAC